MTTRPITPQPLATGTTQVRNKVEGYIVRDQHGTARSKGALTQLEAYSFRKRLEEHAILTHAPFTYSVWCRRVVTLEEPG